MHRQEENSDIVLILNVPKSCTFNSKLEDILYEYAFPFFSGALTALLTLNILLKFSL